VCLLVLAWQAHPRYSLVVAANRDEFHERPAAPLAAWPPPDEIVGGRDLRAHGTWLALGARRRFGAVTNYREPQRARAGAPSRGELIPLYLRSSLDPGRYLAELAPTAGGYAGFNLLLADGRSLWYASNRSEPFARELAPGVYGLSNGLLDTPWPKLLRARKDLESWLGDTAPEPAGLFALLADRTPAARREDLPLTGVDPAWEQVLSAAFVVHPDYGTRCSSVVLLGSRGSLYIAERRFDERGVQTGESELRR
jgi:uncharacterized protein with NRDE domain